MVVAVFGSGYGVEGCQPWWCIDRDSSCVESRELVYLLDLEKFLTQDIVVFICLFRDIDSSLDRLDDSRSPALDDGSK
jgi:hypothetical protein